MLSGFIFDYNAHPRLFDRDSQSAPTIAAPRLVAESRGARFADAPSAAWAEDGSGKLAGASDGGDCDAGNGIHYGERNCAATSCSCFQTFPARPREYSLTRLPFCPAPSMIRISSP